MAHRINRISTSSYRSKEMIAWEKERFPGRESAEGREDRNRKLPPSAAWRPRQLHTRIIAGREYSQAKGTTRNWAFGWAQTTRYIQRKNSSPAATASARRGRVATPVPRHASVPRLPVRLATCSGQKRIASTSWRGDTDEPKRGTLYNAEQKLPRDRVEGIQERPKEESRVGDDPGT